MKNFLSIIVRWAFAVLLFPCIWAVAHQLWLMGPTLGREGVAAWGFYALGALAYLAFEKLIRRPMWLYVFGHELTHAFTGLLSGARIHSFKAGTKGGEVRLSKSNAFIALSPYIFPLYAIGVVVIFAGIQHFWPKRETMWIFQFLLGMAMAFHISLTFAAFHKHQSDLKVLGFFLSGTLIVLGNSLILGILGVSLFTKTPTLPQFATSIASETTGIWMRGLEVMKNETLKRLPPDEDKPVKEVRKWTR